MTVLQLIKGARRLIGNFRMGRGFGTSVDTDSLLVLNAMIDSWNTERLVIYEIIENQYSWPASTASRTIGPSGANFTAARPIRIEKAILINGTQRTQLEILTPQKWEALYDRTITGEATSLYDDAKMANSTLYLWPIPTAVRTLELATWNAISSFANTGVSISLPPGYERALMYNLAVELAPQFPDTNLSQVVIDTAKESKAAIKRINFKPGELACDDGLLNRRWSWDVKAGRYTH